MKNKKHDYKILSNKHCKTCGKPLKQNLVDKNPDADQCYPCYMKNVRRNPSYGAIIKMKRTKHHHKETTPS